MVKVVNLTNLFVEITGMMIDGYSLIKDMKAGEQLVISSCIPAAGM